MSNIVQFVPLRELCSEVVDCPHTSPQWCDSGIPVVRNYNLKNGRIDMRNLSYVDEATYAKRTKRAVPESGDIVISREAPMGAAAILPDNFKCCMGQRLVLLKVDRQRCNPQYLVYALLSQYVQTQIRRIDQTGSIVSNLNIPDLESLIIPIPSINTQLSIAECVGAIDDKIENNNAVAAELEEMAKTIYGYWFLQFDFPDADGRPYRSSGGPMVWNPQLKRDIPQGWEVYPAKECIVHINTGLNPRQHFKLGNGSIKYLTVKNLTKNGTIDWSNCDVINENAREIVHHRSDVAKGDILFASIAPLGRCVLVQENPTTWDINESVFCIRPNYNQVTSEYMYMFLMSDLFIKKAEHSSTGSVFSGIRISVLENMPLLVPPMSIMRDFTRKVSTLLYGKYYCEQQNRELASLRDFLLPLLMNGQATLKEPML